MVDLTEEREQHILLKHPEILPERFDGIARTLSEPDEVRRDARFPATYLFSRRVEHLWGGKFVVVAVVADPLPQVVNLRH
jgi:hypothetical protein